MSDQSIYKTPRSTAGKLLEQGWQKTAFVPGAASGAPPGAPPMDPSMGAMAGAMDPAMAGGGGAMPPMDPAAAMGPPGLDPAAAMGGPPPTPPEGIPPPGSEGAGGGAGARVDPETGETLLPMSEVQELLGSVTGKRAPPREDPNAAADGDPNAAGQAVEQAAAAAPAGDQQTLANPVSPLGGIDPSALQGIG